MTDGKCETDVASGSCWIGLDRRHFARAARVRTLGRQRALDIQIRAYLKLHAITRLPAVLPNSSAPTDTVYGGQRRG